ncbi:MAG: hypothetical protein QOH83_1213 [Solirubrobacteraceae bacterium]|nr:hypothetical protein [Solirubrobacteraceae bacterium]
MQASHEGIGEGGWGIHGWVVMTIWTVALGALAVRAYRHDTDRAA